MNCPGQILIFDTIIIMDRWLEIVQIAKARSRQRIILQQSAYLLIDGHIARKLCERIGITRCIDLYLRDLTHQVVSGTDAKIFPLIYDDIAINQVVGDSLL